MLSPILLLERLLLLIERLLLLLLLERLLLLLLLEWLLLLLIRRLLLVYSQNDYLTCIIIFAIIQIKARSSGSGITNEVVTEDFQFFLELITCCPRDFDERWILGHQNGTNSLCGGTDGTSSCVFGGHNFLVYYDVLLVSFLLLDCIDDQLSPRLVGS